MNRTTYATLVISMIICTTTPLAADSSQAISDSFSISRPTQEQVARAHAFFDRHQVQFVAFSFSDLNGALKEVTYPIDFAKKMLTKRIAFDGSSVVGCTSITNSDMLLSPDLETLTLVPWSNKSGPTARILCDIFSDENTPYAADPRVILRTLIARAHEKGYDFFVGPELEFFIFKNTQDGKKEAVDTAGYFDASTQVQWNEFVCTTMQAMRTQGIDVEKWHHEVAHGQHEISIHYGNALDVADQVILARHTIKTYAQFAGCKASFMPKPLAHQNGSAMHVHFSLYDMQQHRNAFSDRANTSALSTLAQSFIEGILHHAYEGTLLINNTINSFKRLVPGYEAPVNICWGKKNRSALIRIPQVDASESCAVRAEMRSPDALSNPYLTFAFILAAGLDGIEQDFTLRAPVEENLYRASLEQLRFRGIATLPHSLDEAITLVASNAFAHNTFGDLIGELIKIKEREARQYHLHVSHWEQERYN